MNSIVRKIGSWRPVLATIFVVLTFLIGGSSRPDVLPLVILRPMAVIVLGISSYSVSRKAISANLLPISLLVACIALAGIHLLPLPYGVWSILPGRTVVVAIDEAANLKGLWRPISLVPTDSWNALLALAPPAAILVLMIQLPVNERYRMGRLILLLGFVSGIFGFLQAINPHSLTLFPYELSVSGAPSGLFANRNHQAVFLVTLIPILAAWSSHGGHSRKAALVWRFVFLGATAILVPLLVVTGSRSGLLLAAIGLASVPILVRPPTRSQSLQTLAGRWATPTVRYAVVALAVLLLVGTTVLASRDEAIKRMFAAENAQVGRAEPWRQVATMASRYFPVGSGVGTFAPVYQIDETNGMLTENYLNHAHNEYLEVLATAGLPGVFVLTLFVFAWGRGTWRWFRQPLLSDSVRFGRLGSILVFLLALASAVDYPVRVPSLAVLFVIALVWLLGSTDRAVEGLNVSEVGAPRFNEVRVLDDPAI
jgi:O-antigen ligase